MRVWRCEPARSNLGASIRVIVGNTSVVQLVESAIGNLECGTRALLLETTPGRKVFPGVQAADANPYDAGDLCIHCPASKLKLVRLRSLWRSRASSISRVIRSA